MPRRTKAIISAWLALAATTGHANVPAIIVVRPPVSPPPIVTVPFVPAPAPGIVPETKDRLDVERMELLVRDAMTLVRAGNIAAGEAAFERDFAACGTDALACADLLESFGTLMVSDGVMNDAPVLITAGLPYMERAVPYYQRAFGEDHPETALALQSYADSRLAADPSDATAVVDTVRRVYQIRLKTLGANHFETLAARMHLRELEGTPDLTGGDPAKIEAAVGDLATIAATAGDDKAFQRHEVAVTAAFDIAVIYLANGDARRGMAAAGKAWATLAARPAPVCAALGIAHSRWDKLVAARPDLRGEAEAVRLPCRF